MGGTSAAVVELSTCRQLANLCIHWNFRQTRSRCNLTFSVKLFGWKWSQFQRFSPWSNNKGKNSNIHKTALTDHQQWWPVITPTQQKIFEGHTYQTFSSIFVVFATRRLSLWDSNFKFISSKVQSSISRTRVSFILLPACQSYKPAFSVEKISFFSRDLARFRDGLCCKYLHFHDPVVKHEFLKIQGLDLTTSELNVITASNCKTQSKFI